MNKKVKKAEKNIAIEVRTISKINVKVNKNVINEDYRKTITFCEPRPEKIINKFIRPRTPWTFPVSIWSYYDYEYNDVPESYLDKCFEFDFNRCQFNKEFKDEEDSFNQFKSFLRGRYRSIIDCYKYYASLSGYQVWQITQNNLSDFIYKCPNLCDKKYDINNVYLQQKVVVGNLIDKEDKKKKNKNLSENNIVRHQFMNLLVKTAKDKYITVLKTTKDLLEAVKISFEQHYDPVLKGFNYHQWRKDRYYNERVDNFMKTFLPLLDALYLSWAKQKGPKKEVYMDLDEFNSLIQNIVDIDEYPIRDNPFIFSQSIKLQINEIYTEKHLNMMFPEFLEALSRTIDKASPYPPNENKDDWPFEKRKAQPLINKLENVLPLLIRLINNNDFKNLKEKFPIPSKDLLTGLYNPNYENPFYLGYVIKPGTKKGNMKGRASISLNPGENLLKRRGSKLKSSIYNKLKEMNDNIDINNKKEEEKPKENLEINNNAQEK